MCKRSGHSPSSCVPFHATVVLVVFFGRGVLMFSAVFRGGNQYTCIHVVLALTKTFL